MKSRVALLLITIASVTGIPQVKAQNTTLTYQGRLFSTGGTANGSYDLSFALFDASSNGLQQGVSLTNTATAVSNGLFTVQLDFGDQFNGANRWLEIAVRTNGASGFSKLVPRQPLSPTPYAIYSANTGIANSVAATNIVGHLTGTQLPPEVVTNRGSGLILSGTFAGNGGSLSNVNASTLNGMTSTGFWTTTGNASTHSGANFLGTTDAQPLNLQANGQTVLHLEGDAINGARITSGTGSLVSSNAANSSILGGKANMIEAGAIQSTIGGGLNNSIRANQQSAFIGGGARNSIQGGDENGVIVGGRDNWIGTNCIINAILGGAENRLDDNIDGGIIGGGFRNSIDGSRDASRRAIAPVILGGSDNTIGLGSSWSVILGGDNHSIGTNAAASIIGGGTNNLIADNASLSFAAGRRARANHPGTFIWADSQPANFTSAGTNTFNVRASGGVYLNNDTSLFFGSTIRQMINLWGTGYGIGVQDYTFFSRCDWNGSFSWFRGGVFNSNANNPGLGGVEMMRLTSGGLSVNGTFVSSSDRNLKENIEPTDPRLLLEKVVTLPISGWNYKQDPGTPHIGPMAQDFKAAFGLGNTDTGIATVDADGVALAAIQGLNQKVEELKAELNHRDQENMKLKERLERLEQLVNVPATPTR